ncbi:dirigent protein 23 [Selaginella moellendorffii]|nr:dirigent protein 23 [Selaginella moellendorffii]|eukprot:XP_002962783.2 dirigent protein 23 [Selaginella moellendorffii]
MAKLIQILVVVFFFAASSCAATDSSSHFTKCTEVISFYLQDLFFPTPGVNVTTAIVLPGTNNATMFGMVAIIDDKLTEGPSIDSKLVGRAKGILAFDSISNISLLASITLELEGRDGNINLLGQNRAPDPQREISIVGGSGEFRFVQGFATLRTHSLEPYGAKIFWQLHVIKLWDCLFNSQV